MASRIIVLWSLGSHVTLLFGRVVMPMRGVSRPILFAPVNNEVNTVEKYQQAIVAYWRSDQSNSYIGSTESAFLSKPGQMGIATI